MSAARMRRIRDHRRRLMAEKSKKKSQMKTMWGVILGVIFTLGMVLLWH